jgi:hypothetical protein
MNYKHKEEGLGVEFFNNAPLQNICDFSSRVVATLCNIPAWNMIDLLFILAS